MEKKPDGSSCRPSPIDFPLILSTLPSLKYLAVSEDLFHSLPVELKKLEKIYILKASFEHMYGPKKAGIPYGITSIVERADECQILHDWFNCMRLSPPWEIDNE